jgi:hypothetical protein
MVCGQTAAIPEPELVQERADGDPQDGSDHTCDENKQNPATIQLGVGRQHALQQHR